MSSNSCRRCSQGSYRVVVGSPDVVVPVGGTLVVVGIVLVVVGVIGVVVGLDKNLRKSMKVLTQYYTIHYSLKVNRKI